MVKKFKFNKKKRKQIVSAVIDIELECEKMTLELVKNFDLPLNIEEYVALANIIFYKYLYWAEYEIWPNVSDKKRNKKIDYNDLSICKLMSRGKYKNIKNIPLKLLNIFNSNKKNI